ncbi:MAG: Ger(x)C family spore germination protein [Clostridiales bacterium]|nr:Ger(x)C family spore germination protein [Clostridiales bacterium]
MRSIRQLMLLVLTFGTMLVQVGCWDRTEIEKNAFILGIGLDVTGKNDQNDDKVMITYQIALPAAMIGQAGQGEGGGGGGGESSTLNISIEAVNLATAEQTLMATLNQVPNYTHLQLVVFGEELAKKGIEKYIDFFFRDPRVRQRTKVAVCKGKAGDIFKIQPKTVQSTSQYISDLLDENEKHNLMILMPLDFGFMQRHFIRRLDICLPRVTVKKDTLTLEGAGVFSGDKLIDWLTGSEVMGLKWLHGEPAKGIINIPGEKLKAGNIAFKIINNNVSIQPVRKDNSFCLKAKIEVEGDISEIQNERLDTYNISIIREVEKLTEQKIIQSCKEVFKKLVDEYKTDCIEFGRRVQNYYPDFWEKNKEKWNEYFVNTTLDLEAEVKIRRVGVIK